MRVSVAQEWAIQSDDAGMGKIVISTINQYPNLEGCIHECPHTFAIAPPVFAVDFNVVSLIVE